MSSELKWLMMKLSILTLIATTSTMTSYMLWMWAVLPIGVVLLYLDVFVNCLAIGLMFKYNEKWYKLLCKCCIAMSYQRDPSNEPIAIKKGHVLVNSTESLSPQSAGSPGTDGMDQFV